MSDQYHRVASVEAPLTDTTAEDIDQEVDAIYDCLNDLRRLIDAIGAGIRGPQGLLGPQGEDGADGTEGTPGPPGPPGADGPQGLAGSNGPFVPGADGEDGEDGMLLPLSPHLFPSSSAVLAYRATAQSIPVTTETAISFSNVGYDSDTFWAIGNPTRLTVPPGKAGKYVVVGQIKWNLVGTGPFHLRIYRNGGTLISENVYAVTALNAAIQISAECDLAAGDYLELKVYQDSSGGASEPTVGGSAQTFLSMLLAAGVLISGGGGGFSPTVRVSSEVPTGAIDSSNTTFTTANAYDGLEVMLNGLQQQVEVDYEEVTSTTFMFAVAPITDDLVTVNYNVL